MKVCVCVCVVGGGGVIIRGTAIIRGNTVNAQTYDTSLRSTPRTGLKGVCPHLVLDWKVSVLERVDNNFCTSPVHVHKQYAELYFQ